MTSLYQVDHDKLEQYSRDLYFAALVEDGVLRPVMPCEHGRCDAHLLGSIEASPPTNGGRIEKWCHGAGIGVEDEAE